MTGIRVTVEGSNRLARALRQYDQQAVDRIGDAIIDSALEVQGQAQRLIQRGERSGTARPDGSRSSAPGEPPKTDTGRLVASIDIETDTDRLGAAVGTNLRYGKHLEMGTTKMAARPWLFPTFERLKPRILSRIGAAIKAARAR